MRPARDVHSTRTGPGKSGKPGQGMSGKVRDSPKHYQLSEKSGENKRILTFDLVVGNSLQLPCTQRTPSGSRKLSDIFSVTLFCHTMKVYFTREKWVPCYGIFTFLLRIWFNWFNLGLIGLQYLVLENFKSSAPFFSHALSKHFMTSPKAFMSLYITNDFFIFYSCLLRFLDICYFSMFSLNSCNYWPWSFIPLLSIAPSCCLALVFLFLSDNK